MSLVILLLSLEGWPRKLKNKKCIMSKSEWLQAECLQMLFQTLNIAHILTER